MQISRFLAAFALVFAFFQAGEAQAQYRNFTWGAEAGYYLFAPSDSTLLKEHSGNFGFFGGAKIDDGWWYYGKATVAFQKEIAGAQNQKTVVIFHVVPASIRYYFLPDSIRPWVGVTNSFQFIANQTDGSVVWWGPGAAAGVDIKLKRDIYLGFEGAGFFMINFDGPSGGVATVNASVTFFI